MGRLQPMFEQVEREAVGGRAGIARPEVLLLEPHVIKRTTGQISGAIGPLLGIGEAALAALDPSLATPHIGRRAHMAFDWQLAHPHAGAIGETALSHGHRPPRPRSGPRSRPWSAGPFRRGGSRWSAASAHSNRGARRLPAAGSRWFAASRRR